MNTVGSLSCALKFKGDEDKMEYLPQILFSIVQNSNRRHEK
jgi:hypothetical protein